MGRVISVHNAIDYWVQINNCSSEPIVTWEPDRDPNDGTRVYKEMYCNGTNGAEVVLYAVEGGGHTWPSGKQYLPENVIGKTCYDIDANKLIWSFFSSYSLASTGETRPSQPNLRALTCMDFSPRVTFACIVVFSVKS